jgi:hypothetical protein
MDKKRSCYVALASSAMLAVLASSAVAQTSEGTFSGEISGSFGGMRVEGAKNWMPAIGVAGAFNVFKKPDLPLVVEYKGVTDRSSSENVNVASAIDYVGGGLRVGGVRTPFFGSFSGGFAKFRVNSALQIGSTVQTSSSTFTKAGFSLAGGANIPLGKSWGIRPEIRGMKIQDSSQWLYDISGGFYYRWGK